MTYICPKYQVSLTDYDYLKIPCIVDEKENPFATCPVCGKDSNIITKWSRQEGNNIRRIYKDIIVLLLTNSKLFVQKILV